MSNNFSTIQQYYKTDNNFNQNNPYGIFSFYELGPKPFCHQPETKHGFHKNQYQLYQNELNNIFSNYHISSTPNINGEYFSTKHFNFFDNKTNKKNYHNNSNTYLKLIKNILYINLDHRHDRRNNIMNQFQNLPFSLTRIPAVYNKEFGALGCSSSHIKALQYAKKNNLPNVMIIEDDFEFTIDKKYINSIFNYLHDKFQTINWDVIMLCFNNSKLAETKHDFIHRIKEAQVATCYIVNQKYYDVLINNLIEGNNMMKKNGKSAEPKHTNDQCWKSLQEKDNWYAFFPMICKQLDNSHSDIEKTTKNYELKQQNK